MNSKLYKFIDNENKSIIFVRFSPGNKYTTIEEFRNSKYPTYNIENIDGWKIKHFSMNPGEIPNEKNPDWKRLHLQIVNKIIKYCNKHNIKPEDVYLNIDNLHESLENGCWIPSTDSELIAIDANKNYISVSI